MQRAYTLVSSYRGLGHTHWYAFTEGLGTYTLVSPEAWADTLVSSEGCGQTRWYPQRAVGLLPMQRAICDFI